MDHPPLAYRNGEWIAADRLTVDPHDLGFVLGATVAERLRTFQGRLFRLADHWKRLARSLEIVGGADWVDLEGLALAAERLVAYHDQSRRPGDDFGLVVFVTPGPPGGEPNGCMSVERLPFAQWAELYDTGQALVTVSHRQVPGNCWPVELKCRSRMHYYLADQEAREQDSAARALVLDQRGFVAEATTANLLVAMPNEGLVTPRREHILPGVSLQFVQQLAAECSIPFIERDLHPEELAQAEEMLLCSTSPCLIPVSQVDKRRMPHCPGPLFRQLIDAWSSRVGVDIVEQARGSAGRPAPH